MRFYWQNIRVVSMFLFVTLLSGHAHGEKNNLKIYGFFDMEAEANNKDATGKYWTFDQHHFNLLFDFRLDDRIRISSELEWEHGTDLGSSEQVGEMYIAKAYLGYRFSELAQLRVGKFLTPFGLYNERHDATPTFLFTSLPSSVYGKHLITQGNPSDRLFAKTTAGIQFLGLLRAGQWLIHYQTYLTNGRGPKPYEQDNNPNKAIGGRFTITSFSQLSFGMSLYRERNGDNYNVRMTSVSFEAEYDISAFHLEGEILSTSIEDIDSLHHPTGVFNNAHGSYLLGAYTLFDRLTPFVRYDYYKPLQIFSEYSETLQTIGLNYSLTHKVFLKGELHFHSTKDPDEKVSYQMLIFSLAAAL